jgi:hypothetical protein
MGQPTNDDRDYGRRESDVERIPARQHGDDHVYCKRHLRMVHRLDGCPKCDEERDRAAYDAAMDDAAEREAGRVSELMAMEPNHLKFVRGGR